MQRLVDLNIQTPLVQILFKQQTCHLPDHKHITAERMQHELKHGCHKYFDNASNIQYFSENIAWITITFRTH